MIVRFILQYNLKDGVIVVEKSDLALGLYRWARRWTGHWPAEPATREQKEYRISFRFSQIDRRVVRNWVIGGFAMSIVRGEILFQGRAIPLYGFGEFIK